METVQHLSKQIYQLDIETLKSGVQIDAGRGMLEAVGALYMGRAAIGSFVAFARGERTPGSIVANAAICAGLGLASAAHFKSAGNKARRVARLQADRPLQAAA